MLALQNQVVVGEGERLGELEVVIVVVVVIVLEVLLLPKLVPVLGELDTWQLLLQLVAVPSLPLLWQLELPSKLEGLPLHSLLPVPPVEREVWPPLPLVVPLLALLFPVPLVELELLLLVVALELLLQHLLLPSPLLLPVLWPGRRL